MEAKGKEKVCRLQITCINGSGGGGVSRKDKFDAI